MFRLLKLAFYVGLGYIVYEMVIGMLQQEQSKAAAAPAAPAPKPAPAPAPHLSEAAAHTNMTGSDGHGKAVPVDDFGGGTRRQTVGRGVIHR